MRVLQANQSTQDGFLMFPGKLWSFDGWDSKAVTIGVVLNQLL